MDDFNTIECPVFEDPEHSYSYETAPFGIGDFRPLIIPLIVYLAAYLQYGMNMFHYIEFYVFSLALGLICPAFSFFGNKRITISASGIRSEGRRKIRHWSWEEIGSIKAQMAFALFFPPGAKKGAKPIHAMTFSQFHEVWHFIPETVEIDPRINRDEAEPAVRVFLFFLLTYVIEVSFWVTMIFLTLAGHIYFDIRLLFPCIILTLAVTNVGAFHLERYRFKRFNPMLKNMGEYAYFIIPYYMLVELVSFPTHEFLYMVYVLFYLALFAAVWKLLTVISLRIHGCHPWLAVLVLPLFLQWPGERLRWERQHIDYYHVGPEIVWPDSYSIFSALEEITSLDRPFYMYYYAIWPDGRKAVFVPSTVDGPDHIYYYDQDMKLVNISDVPTYSAFLRGYGDVLCWTGCVNEKMSMYCQKFGTSKYEVIPGRCILAPCQAQSYTSSIVSYLALKENEPIRFMQYDWSSGKKTELFSVERIGGFPVFFNADRCNFIVFENGHRVIKNWERGRGITTLLVTEKMTAEAEEEGYTSIELSPFLTHAAWFDPEIKGRRIVTLGTAEGETQEYVAHGYRGPIQWSRNYAHFNGTLLKLQHGSAPRILQYHLPPRTEFYFSPDERHAIVWEEENTSQMFILDLDTGKRRYLLTQRRNLLDFPKVDFKEVNYWGQNEYYFTRMSPFQFQLAGIRMDMDDKRRKR